MFNCRICGKEYETIEEAMDCEQKCYVKQYEIERQHNLDVKRNEEKVQQERAKADFELIKNEYKTLLNHIENHVKEFNENIYFNARDINNYYSPVFEPFLKTLFDPFYCTNFMGN